MQEIPKPSGMNILESVSPESGLKETDNPEGGNPVSKSPDTDVTNPGIFTWQMV